MVNNKMILVANANLATYKTTPWLETTTVMALGKLG